MSVTTGTVANIFEFPNGYFSVRLNGSPTGTTISGWNPPGTYVGSDDKTHRLLLASKINGDVVTVYGTETANSMYTSYENISGVSI